jgi:UDP-2,3-diacylglucosamine pyrophosphatase LpxH
VAIKAGIVCYLLGVRLSDAITRTRRRLGLSYWSLSAAVKAQTLDRVHLVQAFKRNLAADARASGCHGVVAGHVHHPAIEVVDGVLYCNDGDWVESCSALSEDSSGALSIIRWRGWSATSRRRAPRPRCIAEPVRG